MELPQREHIQVESDLGALAKVLVWFDQFSNLPIPHLVWLECQLMLAEGFTNVARHAHRDKPVTTPVDIEITFETNVIELRIWDSGDEFDLQAKLDSMPDTIEPTAESGRGLRLMQRMSDSVHYVRTADNRNCLIVVKHFATDPELAKTVENSGTQTPGRDRR